MSRVRAACPALFVFALLAPAEPSSSGGPISLLVERASGDEWKQVNASVVFDAGDEIRFRFRSSEPGYLYVLNETGRGERAWLFPPAGAPTENRIEAGQQYTLPAGDAAFRVADQPGYDSVYYILTSVRLPSLPSAVPPIPRPPDRGSLLPRCREGTLRARGVCMDQSAGARRVQDRRRIETIAQLFRAASPRDADQRHSPEGVHASGKIYIYELRLAHR